MILSAIRSILLLILRFILKIFRTYHFVICILLAAAISNQTFYNEFLMVDYAINTSEYADHCVNKADTESHCNGKCQLGEKMNENEESDSPQTIQNIVKTVLFCEEFEAPEQKFQIEIKKKSNFSNYHFSNGISPVNSILRPPIV